MHYTVGSQYWQQGLATEMGSLAIQIGFEQLGLAEIGCWTLRVMEKLEFSHQRPITYAGLPHLLCR